jgi:hypothetical protein
MPQSAVLLDQRMHKTLSKTNLTSVLLPLPLSLSKRSLYLYFNLGISAKHMKKLVVHYIDTGIDDIRQPIQLSSCVVLFC